jgi:hypothetical protein
MKSRFLAFFAGAALLALGACSTLTPGQAQSAQTALSVAQATFSTALTLYETVCSASAGASFCSAENQAAAVALEQAAVSAIKVAEAALGNVATGGNVSSTIINVDVQDAVNAITMFSDFVNALQAQKMQARAQAATAVHR